MTEELPLVTIVTPSLNSAHFMEEAIRSVQAQEYPCIEHIIVDGLSSDGTVDILREYDGRITWISEPDEGQADALNKGFRRAQGEIVGWLNADDIYAPGAVSTAVSYLIAHPEVDLVHGDLNWIDEGSQVVRSFSGADFKLTQAILSNAINSTTTFFRKDVFHRVGYLNPSYQYAMDFEFFLRVGRAAGTHKLPATLGSLRVYPGTKSFSCPEGFWLDIISVYDELFRDPTLPREVKAIEEKAYRRMHWQVGLSSFRSGFVDQGRKHCLVAVNEYRLLETDFDFAINSAVFTEFDEWRTPSDPDWISALVEALPSRTLKCEGFERRTRGRFYATRAFNGYHRGDMGTTRKSALLAVWHDITWLQNRGFVLTALESSCGPGVTRRMRWLRRRVGPSATELGGAPGL